MLAQCQPILTFFELPLQLYKSLPGFSPIYLLHIGTEKRRLLTVYSVLSIRKKKIKYSYDRMSELMIDARLKKGCHSNNYYHIKTIARQLERLLLHFCYRNHAVWVKVNLIPFNCGRSYIWIKDKGPLSVQL